MTVIGGLRLADREEVVFTTEAVLYDAQTVRHYEGGTSGFSVRIVKGLTYRAGATRGRSVSTQRIAPLCDGTFHITSKRCVFVGTLRTIEIHHGDLVAFDAFSDGIQLHSARLKRLCLLGFADGEAAAITLSRVLDGGDAPSSLPAGGLRRLGHGRDRRHVSPLVSFLVIGGAFFGVVVLAAAVASKSRGEAESELSPPTTATKVSDAVENLIGRCGAPQRESTRNDTAVPERRLVYAKEGVVLTFRRRVPGRWALAERANPADGKALTLQAAEARLPCAKGLLMLPGESSPPRTPRP